MVEGDLPGDRASVQRLEVGRLAERDAEVPGVQALRRGRLCASEVTYDLVTEEIQGDPIGVPPGELAAQPGHVEVLRRIQVMRGDGEVEDVGSGSHGLPNVVGYSKAVRVSERSPRRSVSSPMTPAAGTLPRFTSGPILV